MVFVLAVLLLATSEAGACPVCHSELGAQVRAGIFGSSFGWNLLRVLAPFPFLTFATWALQRKLHASTPRRTIK